ncbi:transmembrane protein 131-like isoform X1 [Bufo gargarizans]|uniref:transmembrane protein 131-like isoform X1 n=1 Tax=Bufo gargarizans TaxID=30331 RepID=UPI001CF15032|nr:transmembrane protein 131-like isoform X1 [Bufo gargarizans]
MAGLLLPHRGSRCCSATAVNILLGLLHVLLPCFRQGGGQVIEPVPSMVELWQAEDTELLLPTQTDSDQHTGEHLEEQNIGRPGGKALHLQPSVLDFGAQSVGLPKVQTFCAFNPSRDTDIEVNSVFTSGRNFHVSPVHSMVIPARGKSSFTVVFLPDEEGSFESSLFLNTSSHGVMSYQVFGLGTFPAASKNSRSSFQKTDVLFPRIANIHLSQAQAETINSSVWQVRLKCSIPFKQRQPCKSCFLSGHSLLLQVYFAVRLDGGQHDLETLRKYILENIFMIFVTTERNEDIDNSMIMYVMNSGNGLVHMQDIHHFLGDSLFVRFDPVMLLSSSINFTKAATIVCSAVRESECDSSGGKLARVLEAAPSPSLCVSYNRTEGYLNFDTSKISFYIQQRQDPTGLWSLWLENNLNFPVTITDVLVPEQVRGLFKTFNLTRLLPVPPGCWDIFTLEIQAKDSPLNFLTNIMISTSLGVTFEIPMLVHKVVSKSGNQQIISAQCGIHPIIRHLTSEESLRWQHSLSLGLSTWKTDYELGTELYEKYQKIQDTESCRSKSLENPSGTRQKKDAERPPVFLPRLNAEPGLAVNFTATALSNSSVKNILLRNPSPFPVWVQLLPLSYYPNPQAALSLLSKWYDVNELMVDFTTAEFRLQKECDQEHEEGEDCSQDVIELQLQPWEWQQVGVVFTPVDYRKVTSLIVIRNNLTVLDMVAVEGFGAREMLRVGGRLPGIGGSLRFKVPESTLMDCRQQFKESKQVLSITKIFKVENIGSLPITIVSMKINGYKCQGFGFEVLDCYTFSLSQNTSKEISIVFIPDFTSSWVIRELTLISASKLEFRFTLNVTLPHHLLPLCADGVPGPSWEESFWKLTVLFVSLSLFGVILIAIQQAQYILTDFFKLRHRNCSNSSSQHIPNPVDTLTSESYRGSCKSFTDSSSPPDKGKGKGYLAVAAPPVRSQNASKRGPATCSHSQKKHKCSVYYSIKQKPSSVSSNSPTCDPNQPLIADLQPPSPKDSTCSETVAERWTDFTSVDQIDTGNQKHLTSPDVLGAKDSALQPTLLSQRTISESTLKEKPIICMFPVETDFKTSSDQLSEQQNCCGLSSSSKIPEDSMSNNLLQQQTESQPVFRKVEGNKHRASPPALMANVNTPKKTVDKEISAEKSTQNANREEKTCNRVDLASAKHEEPFWKKSPVEKRDGMFPNLNWNKNRNCARKNKKKNSVFPARVTEQNAFKYTYQEAARPELRASSRGKMWGSLTNGDVCRGEQKSRRMPPRGDTECYQILKKKSMDKFSSDSSSECGSSRGSVRASRGSWGSWSSTSSSDGDKKNTLPNRLYFPPKEAPTQTFPSENPISLNLSHSICNTSSDINSLSHYPDILSSPYPEVPEADKSKGLYPPDDVWSAQPMCLTNDLNYNLENPMPCMTQDPPPVQNSYMNWNSTCDGQFSGIYSSLELNDFNSYPEENMNFHNSFSCPDVQNPAFIDQCQSTWNLNPPAPPPAPPPPGPPMPNSWEPTNYVSNSPYLSSTRSLSPMSGLFGSIWAPQNDVFDGYCPVSDSPPHSEHIGTHSMLCKQEYSSRFNPFHAYMNLDIWTTANRNQTFPVSRDSGYCGNM